MKAIILAAGMGTRLKKYTENLPKCMLPLGGKPLIRRQISALREAGFDDIVIIKGYMPETIQVPGTREYMNHDYATTNIVETLMCAKDELDGSVLVCYADILYSKEVLQRIMSADVDVGVTVDVDYLDYWKARLDAWQDDIESLVIGEDGLIKNIGTENCPLENAKVRYVGLLKFSANGVQALKRVYEETKERCKDHEGPVLNSSCFKKLYPTDLLQLMINAGEKVYPIKINRGWLEFDTEDDYERVMSWINDRTIERFFPWTS